MYQAQQFGRGIDRLVERRDCKWRATIPMATTSDGEGDVPLDDTELPVASTLAEPSSAEVTGLASRNTSWLW